MKRANAAVVLAALFVVLEPSRSIRLQKGGDLLLGIPSGFARRGAGRLGGRHTSPATRSLLFGNLLDFVSAGGGEKCWEYVSVQ